jgi:hypothetical protein
MKKLFFSVLIVAIVTNFTHQLNAQNFSSLDKSPMDVSVFPSSHRESNKLVKVTYSRPFLKGRSVSSLAPNGKVWRTGANEAVEIRFYKDVVFGGKEVKKGIYTMFTIPGNKEWTFIVSSDHNVWGAYSYNKKMDVVRVKGAVSKNKSNLENFSITFDKDMTLCLGWGTTMVKLPLTTKN